MNNTSKKSVISWVMYDWANSAFATCVMAGFFPIFFKEYWNIGVEATTSTFRLGLANSIGSLVVIILAPLLGAIADQGSAKKKFLLFFSTLGIAMTGGLYFIGQGNWLAAAILYILTIIGFSGGNIFYDSLLVSVAPPEKRDFVSALGFGFGYLGGGLFFAFCVAMTLKPGIFGLDDASAAVKISFLGVALWWALFTIPIMRYVNEPPAAGHKTGLKAIGAGARQLLLTFQEIRRLRTVFLFLIAYWLYIDGVATIIRMAVDYGMSLGFSSTSLIVALLITQFVGFPAALVYGWIGTKIGTKSAILGGIIIYSIVTVWAMFMDNINEFYTLAVVIGLVQGGVQSLSRSLYSRIIPQDKAAEFFGFYNMLGKFAAILGPLLMGGISILTGSPRLSILSVIILFIAGGILLCFVNEKETALLAEEMK
jgi:MFS transporter, UMF1 family